MYMEQLASDRDSVLHACAAQDSKLLPKYKKSTGNNKLAVQAVVDRLVARGDY